MKTRINSSPPPEQTLKNSLRRLSLILFFLFVAQSKAQTMNAERASQFVDQDVKTHSQQQWVTKKEDQRAPSAIAPIADALTAVSYPFASSTGVALEDMSTATTTLIGPNLDDNASPVTDIGFDFWYDGVRFTQFSVNANGLCRLGGTVITTAFDNSTGFNSTTNAPKIAPYFDDLWIGTNGKVHFKITGSAPTRKLVIEWQNMQIPRVTAGLTGAGTFQMWLFESTGVIKLVYGNGIAVNGTNGGYSIGLQSGAATNFASVTSSTNTVSYAAANNAQSAAITAGRAYTFTPNVPNAPTGLSFTAITAVSMRLNWTDNASNEVGYVIYNSTDGSNFTLVTQTAANATTQNFTNLEPNTNYFWRVYAVTEGALSTVLAGSHSTLPLGNKTSVAGNGNWSSGATWVGGIVPSATDNVTIADTSEVTIDTAAVAYNLTVGQGGGGALKFDATTARTLTVTKDVTVAGNGTFVTELNLASAVTTHILSVGGNLTNNGTLDFCTNPGFAGTNAGASITFTGAANATFSGPGGFPTDIRAITMNKGTSPASTLDLNFPSNFTVLGVNSNVAGFLTLTNGTFKIAGTFTMTNRVFTTAAYQIPLTCGFALNNPNFTVAAQNGSPTVTGSLTVKQGTLNIGTASGNSMGFADGSDITVEGGVISATGRFGVAAAGNTITYHQSGGTITVATVGNTSTSLASFDLGNSASSIVNMNGGTIIVQLANNVGSGPRDYRNQAGIGTATVTGGTLQLGNASSGATQAFNIGGVLPDLFITNTSAGHSATFLPPVIFNNTTRNITINTGNTLNIGNNTFFMNGTTLTNNGTLIANGAASNFFWTLTTAPVSYAGSGSVTLPMTAMTIVADMGLTFNPVSSNIVVTTIRLLSGSVTNSNKITLGTGTATPNVVQIGNTGVPTAGTFDVPFTFNLGSGGETVLYLRTTASRSTGPEINPARSLVALTYDDNDVSHALTVAGGDLTMTSTGSGTSSALQLTNGRIITGASTLILPNAASSVARTTGYVQGNLRKKYSAAGNKTFEVGSNGYSPVSVNATAGSFPLDFTAKATSGLLPGFPNPAAVLARYWTLTASGLTADLTFNYLDPTDIPFGVSDSNFIIYKDDGTLTTPGGSVNAAADTATITGVTSFSNWTLAVPAPIVTNVNDTGAGSLRQAVLDAIPGDTITFNLGAGPHVITLGTEVAIGKNLTINGPANGFLALGGQSTHRIFNINPGSTVTLSNLNLLNGSSSASGGAVFNNGDLTITNCALAGNSSSAANGGALYNGGTAKMTNSTFSQNNVPNGSGGAIFNNTGASVTLGNVTVAQNTASASGGGIMNLGTLNLKNSIVATNTALNGNNVFNSNIATSSGYNLSNDNGGGFLTATGDQINTDPILGPLKENGGVTYTHAPLSNSPAIDTGKDLSADGIATGRDQRGSMRPVTYLGSITPPAGGDRSDIGAVELPPGVIPVSAASVKSHGGTPFSIPLTLSGPAAVECRSTGGSNDYQVVLTFAAPVGFSSANFTSGTGSVGSTTNVGNQVTLNLTGVTNLQTITLALFDTNDGLHSGDVGVRMGMLIGDVSGNGTVNSTDVSQTKLRSGQGTSAPNFRSDINASGSINATDVSSVKLRSGTSLP